MVSIEEFQKMMKRIYFSRDSKRGALETYMWLKEEVDELWEAAQKGERRALEEEFSDVIAWLASLANVLDIDLEKATLNKYDNRCPKCGSSPCECIFHMKRC